MRPIKSVEPWAVEPLEELVRESGARLTMLMTPTGQVIAQYGFVRAVDVMAAAALGAGIVSSTSEIAQMLEENCFAALNHQGENHGIFLGQFDTIRGRMIALVVYGSDSTAGLVQVFYEEFVEQVRARCPAPEEKREVLAANFERELNDNLHSLFGA